MKSNFYETEKLLSQDILTREEKGKTAGEKRYSDRVWQEMLWKEN